MTRDRRLTIQLVGLPSDKDDVRLEDFIDQLATIKNALRQAEMAISGRDTAYLEYKIVDLRHHSPATVVLEQIPLVDEPMQSDDLLPDVLPKFTRELRLIKGEGKLLIEPDLPRLLAYQEIGVTEKNHIQKVKLWCGRSSVTIDETFKQKLNAIVGPDEFAEGNISGTLEAVNFHNTNKFFLYPSLGPKRVAGNFPPGLRPQIKEAIGRFVTVSGRLRFKAWASFPHGIWAEHVDIHEPSHELPTLSEMRGAFAGSTGSLNAVEFVDKLRHEDW